MADAEGIKVGEVWKSIPGYEGVYSVSSIGRVRRDKASQGARAGTILRAWSDNRGYKRVRLCAEGKSTDCMAHRLVAMTFIGEAGEGMQVNHKNGVKSDNCTDNLEWVTPSQNQWHAFHVLGHPLQGVAARGKKPPTLTLREYHDLAKKKR